MKSFQNLKDIEDRKKFYEYSITLKFWKDFNVIIIEPIQAFDYFDVFDLKHDVAVILIDIALQINLLKRAVVHFPCFSVPF